MTQHGKHGGEPGMLLHMGAGRLLVFLGICCASSEVRSDCGTFGDMDRPLSLPVNVVILVSSGFRVSAHGGESPKNIPFHV